MSQDHPAGTIVWKDLTVENADVIRDFYAEVVGWKHSPCDMGGYDDYNMIPPESNDPVAGICHARGANANLPAQWLIYVAVQESTRPFGGVSSSAVIWSTASEKWARSVSAS